MSRRWSIAIVGGFVVASLVGVGTFAGPVEVIMELVSDGIQANVLTSTLVGGVVSGATAGAFVGLPFRWQDAGGPVGSEDMTNIRLLGAIYAALAAGVGVSYLKIAYTLPPGSGFLALVVAPLAGAIVAGWLPRRHTGSGPQV